MESFIISKTLYAFEFEIPTTFGNGSLAMESNETELEMVRYNMKYCTDRGFRKVFRSLGETRHGKIRWVQREPNTGETSSTPPTYLRQRRSQTAILW
jgi:hypothetical protein